MDKKAVKAQRLRQAASEIKASWETEVQEIVRVAQQNPAALIDYLKCNFPDYWGLTREQHRALVRRKA